MKLYYHHVGQKGADEDFKKTIFSEVSISTVEANIPTSHMDREAILQDLKSKFPSGTFNCWGVPEGASIVISNLREGDVVLLVKSATADGEIPALCEVRSFWGPDLRELSSALWGDEKYPYIFFFRTEELTLSWSDFLEQVDYSANYDPRGKFYSVRADRLSTFGGVEGYVQFLRSNFSETPGSFAPITDEELRTLDESETLYKPNVNQAMLAIKEESLAYSPQLTEGLDPQTKQITERPRSAAFVIAVRRAYGDRCAVCRSSLQGPNGESEVQSAHIYPKRLDGRDDVRNGICLCRIHHWALDVGWISIADDYTILVRDDIPQDEEYQNISRYKGKKLFLPLDSDLAPHVLFLREHRRMMDFEW